MNKILFTLLVSGVCFAGIENVSAGSLPDGVQNTRSSRTLPRTRRSFKNIRQSTEGYRTQVKPTTSFKNSYKNAPVTQEKKASFTCLLKIVAEKQNKLLKKKKDSLEKRTIAKQAQKLIEEVRQPAETKQTCTTVWTLNNTLWQKNTVRDAPPKQIENFEHFYFIGGKFIRKSEVIVATPVNIGN